MTRLAALISIVVFVFLLAGCGKDSPAQKTRTDQPSAASGAGEMEDYTPPEDVDAGVFQMLRDEFLKALGEYPERTSASAPKGDAGKVTDLAYDPESGLLTWAYVNLGDYNLSGDVNIADVAEIARYYLADATDGEGDDPFEAWVDGSGDGDITVADVAPIAQNYLNEVSEYVILTSAISDDGFFEIGRVVFGEAKTPSQTGANFPKIFEVSLPVGALAYVTVEPVDSEGSPGEKSVSVEIPAVDEWYIETVDSGGDVGLRPSIALDSSGNPHISYVDDTNHDLKYTYFNGASWEIETVDSAVWVRWSTSIALSSSGNPHISYFDDTNQDLKYTYYDGSSWRIETVDSGGMVGEYSSIALDSSGNPHISYWDETNDDLKYAYYNGTSWQTETVDSGGEVGWWTSIALDSADNPHISSLDDTNGDLKYAYYDGASWRIETVDSEGRVGWFSSIAVDSSDNPHISYGEDIRDPISNWPDDDLKYAHYNGVAWQIVTVDSMGDVGIFTSIALDSSDNPHISYLASYRNEDLKYAYYDGTSWQVETVDSGGYVGYFTSIALDSSDNPHISHYDDTKKDLKYAVWVPES